MIKKHLNLKKQLKKNPFLLAPMDLVTDICFRELCEENGASYTCCELTSVDALIRQKVPKYRYARENLKINCIQLFGSNPNSFPKALEEVKAEADIIDINFGCPSNNVTKNNSGSALLKDPKNVGKIIQALVNNTNLPITAKIRLGYTKTNFIDIAKEIEDIGASLITLHGRTAKQKYSGNANWDAIKELYEKINIPLVGNGDIKSEEDIDKYLHSHCDGLMIGRAAIGNPLIFKRFQYYFKTGEKLEIEDIKKAKKELFIKYLKKLEKIDFYKKDFKIKQQSMWFTKGIEGSKELRCAICDEKKLDKIIDMIKKF